MPDRVKEAIFSMLGNHYDCPGSLPPVQVADVFAGSGSMGLEALSRGAAHCIFYERDRTAQRVLRENIASLDAIDATAVITANAWTDAPRDRGDDGFDLIFLDPPYLDSRDISPSGKVSGLLARFADAPREGRVLMWHHEKRVEFVEGSVTTWRVLDRRVIGSNGITVLVQ